MKIEHVAIWAKDLEKLKDFYIKYFNAESTNKYLNLKKNFESYFLRFDSGARIEIMHKPEIPESNNDIYKQSIGIIHIAFSLGSKENVDQLTDLLKNDNIEILDGPRYTGDGYYETAFLDPEGNRLEITD